MLDTSALIGLVERRNPLVEQLIIGEPARPVVSVITVGELHEGVKQAPSEQVRHARARTLSVAFELPAVGLSLTTADCFGALSAQLGRRVGVADRWIAATALSRSLTLVTEDRDLAEAMSACVLPGYGALAAVCAL